MGRAKTVAKTRIQSGKRPNPKARAGTAGFLTGKNLNIVLCVLLAAATLALYSPVIDYPFLIMDDREYVTANTHIHGGLGWNTVKWAFASIYSTNWHPLTWLSHALDYQLFALNPAGHHLDSVLIHALNTVLLFLLLVWATRRTGPSLLVAALFAAHPLNVESVAWVAERKNVLSTLFFFLAIAAYGWYGQKPGWRRYLLVAALFAAGLTAKPMVITLPFVLLLLDYWPLERMRLDKTELGPATSNGVPRVALSRLLLEKLPLLFLSAASAVITLIAQRRAERTFEEFSFAIRVENAVVSYGLYLRKMLWPARLAAFYPHPANTRPMWQVILSALILTGVTALVVVFRRKRYLPVGWFWFLGTLVPVIGLVQVGYSAMADRYAYVPLIGIFVMITLGLDDLAEINGVHTVWRVIPALCTLTVLGFVTLRQISYWDGEYTVWSHALAVTDPERNAQAHDSLGAALMDPISALTAHDLEKFDTEQKRMDEARQHYEEALRINRQLAKRDPVIYVPRVAGTLNNLGFIARYQNRIDDARQYYEEAVRIHRQLAKLNSTAQLNVLAATLNNLGNLDRRQNQMDEARQHYEEALKIDRQLEQQAPDKYLADTATTLNNLGAVDQLQHRLDDARRHDEEVLEIYQQLAQQNPDEYLPDVALILDALGKLDGLQNRMDDARQHFEGALNIYRKLAQQYPDKYLPDLAVTLNYLGFLDRLQKRIEASRADYTEAMTIYRTLAQRDPPRYAGDVIRVEASLRELDNKDPLPVGRTK
jgi:tetratricopeptide (TPR) repeat protein